MPAPQFCTFEMPSTSRIAKLVSVPYEGLHAWELEGSGSGATPPLPEPYATTFQSQTAMNCHAWLAFYGRIKSPFDFENVILIETMHFDDRPRRIRARAP